MNAVERLLGPRALAEHHARIALVCGPQRLTYAGLAESVARASALFGRLGVGPGDRVLLLMRDTPEFAAAWLGAVRRGAVAIALNNKLSEAEYRHILTDSGARLALIEDEFAEARPDLTDELSREGRLVLAGRGRKDVPAWRERLVEAPLDAAFPAAPDSPAFYLYSSGTTGRPKGIVHTHNSITHVGAALARLGVAPGDRIFSTSKFFFAYGLEHGLLGPLALGATSLLCAEWPDAAAVVDIVAEHAPQVVFSVPTVYRRLLGEPAERLAPFARVRHFVAAGERISPQLVAQWKNATGGELLSLYGMSETFCVCMLTPPGTSDGLRTGEALAGVQTRLAGANGAEPEPGEPGELWVRHPSQASAYVNLPEKSREQFADGWFCTRDMFVRDREGYFIHQGRSDELVKIAGQWVLPSELEEAVMGEAAIGEAVCVPFPDADGLERLALFVTARGEPEEAARVAAAACERVLPRYKRPRWVRVVAELPRTATGKVQRFKLREMLGEGQRGAG